MVIVFLIEDLTKRAAYDVALIDEAGKANDKLSKTRKKYEFPTTYRLLFVENSKKI